MIAQESAVAEVAVAIGSNLGDREECLRYAVRQLERRLERLRASAVYRSPPMEGARGREYLNMCVVGLWRGGDGEPPSAARADAGPGPRGVTDSAARLLDELRFVEIGAGRPLRRSPGEPRSLDLDLLFFGQRRIRVPGLEVPHPRMADRAFVLRPLSEIAPAREHPLRGETVAELADRCRDPRVEQYADLHELT